MQLGNGYIAFRSLFNRIVAQEHPLAGSFQHALSTEASRRWKALHQTVRLDWAAYATRSRRNHAPNPQSRARRKFMARSGVPLVNSPALDSHRPRTSQPVGKRRRGHETSSQLDIQPPSIPRDSGQVNTHLHAPPLQPPSGPPLPGPSDTHPQTLPVLHTELQWLPPLDPDNWLLNSSPLSGVANADSSSIVYSLEPSPAIPFTPLELPGSGAHLSPLPLNPDWLAPLFSYPHSAPHAVSALPYSGEASHFGTPASAYEDLTTQSAPGGTQLWLYGSDAVGDTGRQNTYWGKPLVSDMNMNAMGLFDMNSTFSAQDTMDNQSGADILLWPTPTFQVHNDTSGGYGQAVSYDTTSALPVESTSRPS